MRRVEAAPTVAVGAICGRGNQTDFSNRPPACQHAGHLRLRGLDGARGEWTLLLVFHNLRKARQRGRIGRDRDSVRGAEHPRVLS
jgi:hypothetical protein